MAHQGTRHQLLALLTVVRSFEDRGMTGIKPARQSMRIGTARIGRLLAALEETGLLQRGPEGAWVAHWFEDSEEFEARVATATELHG